jgi:2-methylisocitrate lyase-like PEP mutase family enzyme
MSLRALIRRPMPVTAPLVLNPLMARMAEAAGFPAGYLGGGATGYQKVALEANLNVTEMCQVAVDIGAVSSLPLILDGACGYGDPMHMEPDGKGHVGRHRSREAAGDRARDRRGRHAMTAVRTTRG